MIIDFIKSIPPVSTQQGGEEDAQKLPLYAKRLSVIKRSSFSYVRSIGSKIK